MSDFTRKQLRDWYVEAAGTLRGAENVVARMSQREVLTLLDMASRGLPPEPIGLCAACDQGADPRFPRRHPTTGELIFTCDGCPPCSSDPPEYSHLLDAKIIAKSKERADSLRSTETRGKP